MIRLARTGDTVLVKIREMTGRTQTLPSMSGGHRRGKDDGKQKRIGSVGVGVLYTYTQPVTPQVDCLQPSLQEIPSGSHIPVLSSLLPNWREV